MARFHVNPFTAGLLGGVSGYAAGVGKYFDTQRALDMRLQAYKYRYDRMADVAKQREDFAERMATKKMQSMQRHWTTYDKDPDTGEVIRKEMTSTFNPDTSQWEDVVKSSIPQAELSKAQSKALPREVKPYSYDEGGMRITVTPDGVKHSSPKWNPNAGRGLGAGANVTATSQAAAESAAVNKYMALPDEGSRDNYLASYGIDPEKVTDPKERREALEKAVRDSVRNRARAYGSDTPANAADVDATSHSPNAMDGLVKGKDGWYTGDDSPVPGQKVFFNKGVPYLQAKDKDGQPIPNRWVPYQPGGKQASMTPAAANYSDGSTDSNPGLLASESNDDDVNREIAGIDTSTPQGSPYDEEEEET